MFVDAKISAIDRAGKRYDDPRAQGVRALFGTAAFKGLRLEVEEDALKPDESSQARTLLVDLGQPPTDGGEVALKEATLQLATSLSKRLAVIEKAKLADLPLPASYSTISTALESLSTPASRVKVVRTLLAQAQELKYATAALKRLEEFDGHSDLEKYRRSQLLLHAALQAGLAGDPV
jgi:hypothetical protein